LIKLDGVKAIIAGIALKAAAGLLRGIASNNSPSFGSASRSAQAQRQIAENNGPGVTIHVDNFIGSRAFINDLMREINSTLRTGGHTEVFFAS